MNIALLIVILGILVLLSAFFSASEMAIISLTEVQVREIKKKTPRIGRLIELQRRNAKRLLITIAVSNNFLNVFASSLATAAMIMVFPQYGVAIATAAMTFIILLVGEIVPKVLAIKYTKPLARQFAQPLWVASIIVWPVAKMFDAIVTVFIKDATKTEKITEDTIKLYVQMGHEVGAIDARKKEYINNILSLDRVTVGAAMTPRSQVFSLQAGTSVEKAVRLFGKSGYSRAPMYEKNPSNITGIIHVRDIISQNPRAKIRGFAQKPMIVPQGKGVGHLLRELQDEECHLAIVIDNDGNYEGIITIEDVLEEIIGEIYDETDERVVFIRKIAKNSFSIRGDYGLLEFNRRFGMRLEGASTIGGYIMERLKDVPKKGDVVDVPKGRLEVLRVIHSKVKKLHFRKF